LEVLAEHLSGVNVVASSSSSYLQATAQSIRLFDLLLEQSQSQRVFGMLSGIDRSDDCDIES
jgi:hypothetical protein